MMSLFVSLWLFLFLPPPPFPSGWRRRRRCGQCIRWRDSGERAVQASGSAGSHRGCKRTRLFIRAGEEIGSELCCCLFPLAFLFILIVLFLFVPGCKNYAFGSISVVMRSNKWLIVSFRSWKKKSQECLMQTTRTPQKTLSATTSRLDFCINAVLSCWTHVQGVSQQMVFVYVALIHFHFVLLFLKSRQIHVSMIRDVCPMVQKKKILVQWFWISHFKFQI